jgi:hypothetical protein
MNRLARRSAVMAAAIAFLYAAFAMPVVAGVKDYEFQLVQNEVKKSDAAVVAVRLIDKRSGKAVPDAVISAKRIDMAPDGMPTMAAPLESMPPTEPGLYRFKAALPMPGNWQLSLAAKVQGESGTLESKFVLKVMP